MGRHPEKGAGAIVHQHEVRDVDGQAPLGVKRVDCLDAGKEAFLFGGLDLRGAGAAGLALGDERCRFRMGGGDGLGDRMVGRDGDEARAEDRVRTRGEHIDRLDCRDGLRNAETELEAAAPADPILLHQTDLVGPLVERLQPLEQIVGEVGDLEEPLGELAPLDRRPRAPALAVDHLLIGEHGHVDRVPIDLAFLAIDQPGIEQVEELRLLVPVIRRVAGRELSGPVEREADALQLLAHRFDIGPGPLPWMDLALHRGIFGRHPKRVPAHRVQHFHTLHPAEAGQHVPHRIVADMPHVDAPGRIGEHLQHVGLGLVAVAVGAETLRLVPARLPAPVGFSRVEPAAHPWTLAASAAAALFAIRAGNRRAAKVAGPGQDDILNLLDRRRGHRGVIPGTVLIDLLGRGNADRVGAKVGIEHGDSELHPLKRNLGVPIPVGDDDSAAWICLDQRSEREGIDRGAPQVGVDRERRHLRGRELVRQGAVPGAAGRGQSQNRQGGSGRMEAVHLGSSSIGEAALSSVIEGQGPPASISA